jgi:hypothetical protein
LLECLPALNQAVLLYEFRRDFTTVFSESYHQKAQPDRTCWVGTNGWKENTTQANPYSKPRLGQNFAGEVIAEREDDHDQKPEKSGADEDR